MTVSYFFTISLVFSSSELGIAIGDLSGSRVCRDTNVLGAAITCSTKNKAHQLENKCT